MALILSNLNGFVEYRVGQKTRTKLMAIILSKLNRFSIFFTGIFYSKFAAKFLLKISPHFAYAARLYTL